MKNRVYLAGAMKGKTLEECLEWRAKLEESVCDRGGDFEFISPPIYYNYDEHNHKTEREVKEFEIQALTTCNILVVNFDGIQDSVGTHYELATADAINRFCGHNIFIIGIGDSKNVHPWILESCHRLEDDVESAADYMTYYFCP